jgi:tetratricopeptide (TPR) repeat protein
MRAFPWRLGPVTLLLALAGGPAACRGASSPSPQAQLTQLRAEGSTSTSAEAVGRWALAEMLAPGGDARQATAARARLDTLDPGRRGMYADIARAIYDEAHGAPRPATEAYVATLVAAQSAQDDPDAALVSWYATHHLLSLRGSVTGLFASHRAELEALIASPGSLGWRALAELVDWSGAEDYDAAESTGDAYDLAATKKLGCVPHLMLAGPFGRGSAPDRRRSFGAERPGPWPPSWPAEAVRGTAPHVLKVEQHRCYGGSTEDVGDGVFYAQTFFTSKDRADVLVAVQGALALWIDDTLVLERDLRQWGVWQRFGTVVRVGPGRHRVLARLMTDGASVRLLTPDGRPADLTSDVNDQLGYGMTPPVVVGNPNPIDALVSVAARGDASSVPWLRAILAGYAAHVEGLNDVADVLVGPLVEPDNAAAVALEIAAQFASGDPALPSDVQQRTEKDLRSRAVTADARLWASRGWLILEQARQAGLAEGVQPFRKLAAEFPDVPEILGKEAQLYGELGWRAERIHAVSDLAQRFPEDLAALRAYVEELDEIGSVAAADAVAARLTKLDPDAEIALDRALARHDWSGAVSELRRLSKRRPERKDLAVRIADVLARAGDPNAAAQALSAALAKNPEDSSARFRIADSAYARGDVSALRRALAEALQVGAKPASLRAAIDLVEGATDLEPYRLEGRAVIREFEAWEKTGQHMDGNAARVLDYSALWVHPDAASDMLEHEILLIQSQEAIGELAEQPPPTGLVLHLRVIKADGSILEPEPVGGKHSLTMPHLEVGDYVEIEHITQEAGDGEKGLRYRGPEWFFREPDKGYWRSEFVAVTPKDRSLEIETRGNIQPPRQRTVGSFDERRWRVDLSPPAPKEPDSPPLNEFLPSIRLGWGISLTDTVERLVDFASAETPLDPRLRKRALDLVKSAPADRLDEQVRLIYEDVAKNVADGNESDGRRAVMGKSGSRQAAFQYLVRELGIPTEAALVKNRLATTPLGNMTEVETYDGLLLRIQTGASDPGAQQGVRWLSVRDKFAPAWYVPAEFRGQPAIRLIAGTPYDTTPPTGGNDGVSFSGTATLLADGSASVELSQRFEGKAGIGIRGVLDKVPGTQLHDFIESAMVGRSLPGARLRDFAIENKDASSALLVLRIRADVPALARREAAGLTIAPIFPMNLNELAALPERQTPLLLQHAFHVEVHFEIVVPEALRPPTTLTPTEVRDGERAVVVRDAVHGRVLVLDRVVDIPAGRVLPGPEYARFLRFIHDGDNLVQRQLLLGK